MQDIRQGISRRQLLATGSASALFWSAPAFPQTDPYPRRAITLILPNAPGSSLDTVGRIVARSKSVV